MYFFLSKIFNQILANIIEVLYRQERDDWWFINFEV